MKSTTFKELAIVLVSLSLVFIFGCSENNPINTPDDQINSSVTSNVTAAPNFIKLPKFVSYLSKGKGKSKDNGTGFEVTKWVKANKNTDIKIKDEYETLNHKKVKVDIKITFKKGTVAQDTEITMKLNIETGVLEFLPHMIFNEEALLDYKVDGYEEGVLDDADLSFFFLCPDGSYEEMDKHKLKIKVEKGSIQMLDAKLPHFSRYGFSVER